MLQDLRYAIRALRRSAGFAVTAIVTLALSVALGTSLFATVDAIFFRTLPVHAPEELVYLYWIGAYRNSQTTVAAVVVTSPSSSRVPRESRLWTDPPIESPSPHRTFKRSRDEEKRKRRREY